MIIFKLIAIGYLIYSLNGLIDMLFNTKFSFSKYTSILFACSKCIAFWGVLIAYQNIFAAALVSMVVFLLDTFIVTKL